MTNAHADAPKKAPDDDATTPSKTSSTNAVVYTRRTYKVRRPLMYRDLQKARTELSKLREENKKLVLISETLKTDPLAANVHCEKSKDEKLIRNIIKAELKKSQKRKTDSVESSPRESKSLIPRLVKRGDKTNETKHVAELDEDDIDNITKTARKEIASLITQQYKDTILQIKRMELENETLRLQSISDMLDANPCKRLSKTSNENSELTQQICEKISQMTGPTKSSSTDTTKARKNSLNISSISDTQHFGIDKLKKTFEKRLAKDEPRQKSLLSEVEVAKNNYDRQFFDFNNEMDATFAKCFSAMDKLEKEHTALGKADRVNYTNYQFDPIDSKSQMSTSSAVSKTVSNDLGRKMAIERSAREFKVLMQVARLGNSSDKKLAKKFESFKKQFLF